MLNLTLHLFLIELYKYYIGSNSNNFSPWNTKFTISAKTAEIFARSRYDKCLNIAAFLVKFQVSDIAETSAVTDIDHFFFT